MKSTSMKNEIIILFFLVLFFCEGITQAPILVAEFDTNITVSDLKIIGGRLHFSAGGHYFPKNVHCKVGMRKGYFPNDYFLDGEKNEIVKVELEGKDSNFLHWARAYPINDEKIILIEKFDCSNARMWMADKDLTKMELVNKFNSGGDDYVDRFQYFNEKLYLSVGHNDYYLWETDGTEKGTKKVMDHIQLADGNYSRTAMANYQGEIYFIGWDSLYGRQVYYLTEKNEAIPVTDISDKKLDPKYLMKKGDLLLFAGANDDGGRDLWLVNAITKKCKRISDFGAYGFSKRDRYIKQIWIEYNGLIYFSTKTGQDSYGLFYIDDGDRCVPVFKEEEFVYPKYGFSYAGSDKALYFCYYKKSAGKFIPQVWKISNDDP